MVSQVALAELKLRNPCDQVAGQWVALREHGKKLIGPCPLHSPDPRARFHGVRVRRRRLGVRELP